MGVKRRRRRRFQRLEVAQQSPAEGDQLLTAVDGRIRRRLARQRRHRLPGGEFKEDLVGGALPKDGRLIRGHDIAL